MKTTNSNILSPAEVEFLKVEADAYGWYVWTDRTHPMIQALCERHLIVSWDLIERNHFMRFQ